MKLSCNSFICEADNMFFNLSYTGGLLNLDAPFKARENVYSSGKVAKTHINLWL